MEPTPQQLYRRLRELHPEATSDEKLSRVLALDSVKPLQQLKRGDGVLYQTLIHLLHSAGWLDMDGESTLRAQVYQASQVSDQLYETLSEIRSLRDRAPE